MKTPFQINLNKENRWLKLGNALPWDALAGIYYRYMSSDKGAPAIDARIVRIAYIFFVMSLINFSKELLYTFLKQVRGSFSGYKSLTI